MKTLWIVLLTFFVGMNVYALAVGDLAGLGEMIFSPGPWELLAMTDLVMALLMVVAFIAREVRARGRSPLPWILATVGTGSIAPLYYLARHWGRAEER